MHNLCRNTYIYILYIYIYYIYIYIFFFFVVYIVITSCICLYYCRLVSWVMLGPGLPQARMRSERLVARKVDRASQLGDLAHGGWVGSCGMA